MHKKAPAWICLVIVVCGAPSMVPGWWGAWLEEQGNPETCTRKWKFILTSVTFVYLIVLQGIKVCAMAANSEMVSNLHIKVALPQHYHSCIVFVIVLLSFCLCVQNSF